MNNKKKPSLPGLRYPLVLLGLLLLLLLWSGLGPDSRFDWFVDNALGLVLLVLVVVSGQYFRLSNISYTAMFVFMALHVIGSHWTYQETPFGYTLAGWFGNTERNHYDRLVHFAFGLCFFYPVREVCLRIADMRRLLGPVRSLRCDHGSVGALRDFGDGLGDGDRRRRRASTTSARKETPGMRRRT